LISIGGAAFGAAALGGWAMGGWAAGGGAVAWFAAHGGFAIAQHHAMGGLAVAHEYATGGTAMAIHANDGLAKTVIAADRFIALSRRLMENSGWLVVLPVLSVVFGLHQWRKPRNAGPKADRALPLLVFIASLGCQMQAEKTDYVVAQAVDVDNP
jgi:hypothetical protein